MTFEIVISETPAFAPAPLVKTALGTAMAVGNSLLAVRAMLHFGAIPPEINSSLMYAGPGSGPLIAAAAAWDGLAVESDLAVTGYTSVISELIGSRWMGPAVAAMAASITPYVAWLSATATRAELAAAQARAAAAAFETAHAKTVPPPVVAANRTLLKALIATNFLGHNTPAIAFIEFHYAEMWAQDAEAMYDYASSSLIASMLDPFAPPPQTTNSAGLVSQAAAVGQAAATPVGTCTAAIAQTTSELICAAGETEGLQQLSAIPWYVEILQWLEDIPTQVWLDLINLDVYVGGLVYDTQGYTLNILQLGQALAGTPTEVMPGTDAAPIGAVGVAAKASLPRAGAAGVSASLGQAGKIGPMSAPPSWAGLSSAPHVEAVMSRVSGTVVHDAVPVSGPAGLLRGLPMVGPGRTSNFASRRYGSCPRVIGPRSIG